MTDQETSHGGAPPALGRFAGGPDGIPEQQIRVPAVILAVVAVLVALDINLDWDDGASLFHVMVELSAAGLAGLSALALWWRLQSARRQARLLASDLRAAHADAAQLRADVARFRAESQQHARGLGEAIDRQFQRWGLSPAEREVALLLVKGLSHKEAAEVRATSERTVRQQALAVYRKAGLGGRAELAAFFLEDLLLPAPAPLAAGAAAPPVTVEGG
jgi:DNA-binding CsgD family transcriptional regulator